MLRKLAHGLRTKCEASVGGAHEQIRLVLVGDGGRCVVVDHGGSGVRCRRHRRRLVELRQAVEVELVGVAFAVDL